MRVVHFNTYGPFGGAGKAAHGIHSGLLAAGCDSWMIVAKKAGDHHRVIEAGNHHWDESSTIASRKGGPISDFSADLSWLSRRYPYEVDLPVVPDVIHMHWIAGFLFAYDIHQLWLRYRTPVVWTMHDMSPLTGGCHYSGGCDGFTRRCGRCPILRSNYEGDTSRRSWISKSRWLRDVPITLVGASHWSLQVAERSSQFRDAPRVRIPSGIDDAVFRPRRREGARKLLRLPVDAQVIFIGAANHRDTRKGMRYIVEALGLLGALLGPGPPPIVLTVGAGAGKYPELLPFQCFNLGQIADDRLMALAYQAADAFVCASLEDAGPMMIPESLLCGTPVVAFDSSGLGADLVRKGVNGYLAKSPNAHDLARGIHEVLSQAAAGTITPQSCRDSVLSQCGARAQTDGYLMLYDRLMSAR